MLRSAVRTTDTCFSSIQFIVPSLISNLVLANIYGDGRDRQIPPDKSFQYRAVGMGIFLGTFVLFWTPLVVWKIIVSSISPNFLGIAFDAPTYTGKTQA
jgi:hypothetical protein